MGFKLAISNIAWAADDDQAVYALMHRHRFTGLEIAPTRVFPDNPYDDLERAKAWSDALRAEHGFDLVTSGAPALFYLRIANDDSMVLHQEWVAEMVKRGIFLASHHNHFMNASVTDKDIELTLEVADEAFKAVAKNHPELF